MVKVKSAGSSVIDHTAGPANWRDCSPEWTIDDATGRQSLQRATTLQNAVQ